MRTLNIKLEKINQLSFVILFAVMLVIGCKGKLQPSFDGVFVNSAKSEFSIANDTLSIEKKQQNIYVIHRSTGIQLIDEAGKPTKFILEKEEWNADLNPETNILKERSKGRMILIDGDSLKLEHAIFRRVP